MGYQTDFDGSFRLDRALAPGHAAYLTMFSRTRRMQRDAAVTDLRPDLIRDAVGLPVGDEGGYFVGEGGLAGQVDDSHLRDRHDYRERSRFIEALGILDYNNPPKGQPGLWCGWIPNEDGTAIEWNEVEKFYGYVEWITYLVEHFLAPWGYVLNGNVLWQGEEIRDRGIIKIENNAVRVEKLR